MMIIKLIRHGESEANTGKFDPTQVKDAAIPLSLNGIQQARDAGAHIGRDFINNALLYCSPYERTRQTCQHILAGAGLHQDELKVYEDPRLREIDVGYGDTEKQLLLRQLHGWFYYRFDGGESPADCYDRTSAFLESMMRQVKRQPKPHIMIVCHGMTLRCFVARFLHLSVEQFENMHNPNNGDVVTLGPVEVINHPVLTGGRWAVAGLRLRQEAE